MKQNKYDDEAFFQAYEQMARSTEGLKGAGEWHVLQPLIPDLQGKSVLDLGCGFGWHCKYALEQGASKVVGVDISTKMLEKARTLIKDERVEFIEQPIEDIEFPAYSFDVVISSLAFHYLRSFSEVVKKISNLLKPGGTLIFTVEHPIFTARAEQDWHYDQKGKRLHWPIDDYQDESLRETSFLTENVVKYHRTVSTYLNNVIDAGLQIKAIREPKPSEQAMTTSDEMRDENRRPMFLIIKAEKN
ncbi:class I SAM-dependent methyltransferase [Alkalihalobacillus sp. 1P02AB]|uniref:class I SAM-dependent methyltransferase n=1 Tax=Alkalihalobacillus sp. 1P02AB TaxID=3132260 RepID=UPI0039A6126D